MPDVLIYADTFRTPELRHEVPLGVPDPFLYAETGGKRHIAIGSMEIPRLAALGMFELHPSEEYGIDELIRSGMSYSDVRAEVVVRAVKGLGVSNAVVPETFPLWLADRLRADGVELTVDREFFNDRRRVKTEAELAGMKRAQRAAEAGMDMFRDMLRRAEPNGDGTLSLDAEPLTVERAKGVMFQVYAANGATADDIILAPGPQGAVGHDMGSGPISAGVPIVVDVWPRDNESFMFCDMTRTFVVGDVPEEIREWHGLCKQALDRAVSEIKDGVDGRAIFDGTCEIFEAAGQPTQRTKKPGETLSEGFFHGLGHGVGLEVHEQPGMGQASTKPLKAGDVVTVEPGCYRQGFGGVRLEDLVLVTENGAENLTDYPYELEP
ncbi:MAG TPA: Xaa-Pro peptidase family protein [Gaiellaceae bacterium]|jgi:Xaa-Pro aminopeptidase|nr:Xaa-Pro peptidase family protein [Gaiellaceae bacterium]